jgi:WD40 repeat protein
MTRALFALALALPLPLLAADPLASVTLPGAATTDGPRFSVGRPTDYMTTVLAFSADGKTVAATTNRNYTGGMDAPVHLWDAETGKHVRTLKYHTVGVMAAAFSRDGSVIATSGIDNKLRFWDGKTGKDITKAELPLTGHGYALTFSPDGKRLLVGSTKLEMYDVQTQKPINAKPGYFAETDKNQFFHTATWSPKGKYVAAACDGAGVRIWEADTGNLVRTVTANYTPHRTRFAFSSDDKLFLLSTWPKGVMEMFDAESGKSLKTVDVKPGEASPETVQFAREMGRVAWVAQAQPNQQGGRAVVVADATGQELKRFEVASGVLSHQLSPDGARLAVGGQDGSLRVYAAETGKLQSVMLGGWSAVYQSAYADSGKVLRVVHADGLVHDFDANDGKPLRELKLDLKAMPHPVALSVDGKFLASASEAGDCAIWNLDTGKELSRPKGKLSVYREPGIGRGGPFPLPPGGGAPAAPPALPLPGGGARRPPPPIDLPPGPPQFAANFSADGKFFAAVTGEGNAVAIWESATGEEKHALKVPKGTGAVAFSTDAAYLFTGQTRPGDAAPADGDEKPAPAAFLRRFELKSGKEVQTWKAGSAPERKGGKFSHTSVVSLHALPDAETLAVVESQVYNLWPPPPGGFGRVPMNRYASVRLVDLAGRKADRFVAADREAAGIGVSPDGKRIGFVVSVPDPITGLRAMLRVVDVKAGTVTEATPGDLRNHALKSLFAFRPDGKDFVVGTGDGALQVWELAKLKAKKPDGKKE